MITINVFIMAPILHRMAQCKVPNRRYRQKYAQVAKLSTINKVDLSKLLLLFIFLIYSKLGSARSYVSPCVEKL